MFLYVLDKLFIYLFENASNPGGLEIVKPPVILTDRSKAVLPMWFKFIQDISMTSFILHDFVAVRAVYQMRKNHTVSLLEMRVKSRYQMHG